MLTNMNGKYTNVGEVVIFSDGRFNYQQDSMGNTLSKEPGTAGMAFVAVRQKDKDTCEAFSDSRGIEQTILSRPNLMAGYFALYSVLREIKSGDWKASNIQRVSLVTRSDYLYRALVNGMVYRWQFYDWKFTKDGMLMERLNRDLWEYIIDILNDFENIGIEVETMILEKDNYSVLNTLTENPITLALQASNGTNLIKDKWFEETFGDITKKS